MSGPTVMQQEIAELKRVLDAANEDRYALRSQRDAMQSQIARLWDQRDTLRGALKKTIAAHCKDDRMFCGSCSPAREALAATDPKP